MRAHVREPNLFDVLPEYVKLNTKPSRERENL